MQTTYCVSVLCRRYMRTTPYADLSLMPTTHYAHHPVCRSTLAHYTGQTPCTARHSTVPIMKIAFVHPDLGIGGAERLVVDAAVALQDRGHSVIIYTSHYSRDHCFAESKRTDDPDTHN